MASETGTEATRAWRRKRRADNEESSEVVDDGVPVFDDGRQTPGYHREISHAEGAHEIEEWPGHCVVDASFLGTVGLGHFVEVFVDAEDDHDTHQGDQQATVGDLGVVHVGEAGRRPIDGVFFEWKWTDTEYIAKYDAGLDGVEKTFG